MQLSKQNELSKVILDDPHDRWYEIYKITNLTTKKSYVGQAVSHILNHRRYRPHGTNGRFRSHISEAYSKKKNQSHFLNNAIRKYGVHDFVVKTVKYCEDQENANVEEERFIESLGTLFPNGYNLRTGGQCFEHTMESKQRVSLGVTKYYEDKKMERFMNTSQSLKINDDIETYIKPLRRDGRQYGWYVYVNGIKADFGGVHISLIDSRKRAVAFIYDLKEILAKQLVAGNSLSLNLPLLHGNM